MTRATALRRASLPALPAPLRTALGAMAFLLLWEALAQSLAGSYLLAGPTAVARHAAEHAGLLWRALGATVEAAALGYLWGNLAAIAMAAVAILVPWTERPLRLLGLIVFCLPLVATGPILRVLFGPGIGPQVTLSALGVFYTTLVPLLVGLRAVPQSWLDLVASYGRGRGAQLLQVRAMASLPYLAAGLQIAAPAAFLGAMIGEFTGAERGMGVLALRAMRTLDTEATWTLAVIAAVVSIAAYAAAGWGARRIWPDAPAVLLAPPPVAAPGARWRGLAEPLAVAALVLAGWQLAMDAFDLSPFFAKRPGDVWAYLVADPAAAANRARLLGALAQTLQTALPGYLAGLAGGFALAVICVLAAGLAQVILPVAIALRAVPIITTAPLIVLALGRGAAGTVTIVAVMIFFPTLIACLQGLRLVPAQVVDMFDSYASGRWRTLTLARIPAMLPAFFAAARMSIPAALLAATVAEWLATGTGLGNLMALSASTSDYGMLWSATVALALVAVLAHAGVARLERDVLARYAPEQLRH